VGVVTSTDRAIEQTCRELVRSPSGQGERRPIDPHPARPPSGVQLARLIALAGLTPAQALDIGAGLVAAVANRSEPDTHGLDDDQVLIGIDGRVVLARASSRGRATTTSACGATSAAIESMLAELAGAARRRARPADPLLAELERAVALVPLADLPVVARMLENACAAVDRDDVRAGLSALVRAIWGISAPIVPSSTPIRAPSTVAAGRVRPVARRASGRGRVAMRRIGAWLLSVAVVVTIVLLEVAFLRDDIAADVHLLLDAGRSGSALSVASEPEGVPLVPPAPPQAGSVTAVDLRALDRCTPGTPCTMRVLVRLVAVADPQTLTWVIRIVDRCTGVAETVPGGSVVIAPGEEQATAVGMVPLPQAASAVFAVTGRPAVAAGPPVLVGSCPSAPAQ
jgi:hypothetical protein